MNAVDQPSVGLLLDTFHMHIEEKSTADAIRRAGMHIKHFHCSENDRGAVGSGQVDWTGTFQALADVQYSGWLVVESFNAIIPELAGRDMHLASPGREPLRAGEREPVFPQQQK